MINLKIYELEEALGLVSWEEKENFRDALLDFIDKKREKNQDSSYNVAIKYFAMQKEVKSMESSERCWDIDRIKNATVYRVPNYRTQERFEGTFANWLQICMGLFGAFDDFNLFTFYKSDNTVHQLLYRAVFAGGDYYIEGMYYPHPKRDEHNTIEVISYVD